MTFIDEQGVPRLVQQVVYLHHLCYWEVTYFNGKVAIFDSALVTPHLGLNGWPKDKEYYDVAVVAAQLFHLYGKSRPDTSYSTIE